MLVDGDEEMYEVYREDFKRKSIGRRILDKLKNRRSLSKKE